MKASDSELVTVYSAASQLRDPAQLARDMLHDLGASRELAWRLFVRNVSARYRQTFLGYTWAVLPPLLTTLVFVCLHQAGFFSVEKTSVPYGLFVLSGMTFWQLFADALQAPMRMVSQSAPMLTKVRFPREALILAAAGEVLFAFAIRFALLIAAMVWFKQPIGASFVLLPLGILALTMLGMTLGLWITPLATLYQDVSQGLPFFVSMWMFVTPVLYPARGAGSSSALWMSINPMTPLLDTTRAWLFASPVEWLNEFSWILGLALLAWIAGWLLFRLAFPILIERMNG
jgi:lipopolysaccharide transport system permease protein